MEAQDIEQFFIDGRENLGRAADVVFIEGIVGPLHAAIEKVAGILEASAMSFPPRRIWSSVVETEIDGVLGRREALRIDGQKILQGPWNSSARPFRWTYGMTCCSISGVPRKAC